MDFFVLVALSGILFPLICVTLMSMTIFVYGELLVLPCVLCLDF